VGAGVTFYWHDFETGRSGIADGDLPDGPLVEEITAREFYIRESKSLSCGWPELHHAASEHYCRCGFVFPARAPERFHHSLDDDALS
jgi:hypothetical protein